jgi:surface protein
MRYMFYYCRILTSIDLSFLDTSKVTTMGDMFSNCDKLETLSSINCSGITGTDSSGAGMFGYSGISTLKNFGGWIGLKKSVTNYGINKCPNLTYESCINVLNGLYDFTGNGIKPASNEGKLKVHQNFLNLVGDEISIGTNKGWTITS